MRYLFVIRGEIIDSLSGEVLGLSLLEVVMRQKPGGVIVGNNLYPVLSKLIPMVKTDEGWSASIKLQKQRKGKTDRVGGVIYFSKLIYRFSKQRQYGRRYRPGSVKWTVINLELFSEVPSAEIRDAGMALVDIAEKRGISVRDSPGGFGGALLRASREWNRGRRPAPWFISEAARIHLPGNFYALRSNYSNCEVIDRAYYIDQKSSHHTIASSVNLPHPHSLRARGRIRAVESGRYPIWLSDSQLSVLLGHVGLICAVVECDKIPPTRDHLYPPWCKNHGKHHVWMWTPELRLLDRRVRLRWISAAYTSYHPDLAIREYAEWCIGVLREGKHSVVKSSLLAGYGLLGIRHSEFSEKYIATGREKPDKVESVKLPLIGDCYRTVVKTPRVSPIQNVIARGVIEAETRTRSIEYARDLESQGVQVSQIYADAVVAVTDTMPLLPPAWRIAGELTNLYAPSANSIVSDRMTKTPGIPNGRRLVKMQ